MKTLVAIYTHKDAEAVTKRHLQFWKDLGHTLLMVSPANASLLIPGIQGLTVGKSQHHGEESIKNFRIILEQLNGQGYDRYAFFEYDSIPLGPLPEVTGAMGGIVFNDDGSAFSGSIYVHPPLIFTARGLETLVNEMKQMPLAAEHGFWDRFLGLAIQRTGIVCQDFHQKGIGYSTNTIHPEQHKELFKAVVDGCQLIHGVKDKETLDVIVRAWNKRQNIIAANTPDELEK